MVDISFRRLEYDDSSHLEFERYMWKKEAIHFSHLVVAIKLKLTVIFLEAPESRPRRRSLSSRHS